MNFSPGFCVCLRVDHWLKEVDVASDFHISRVCAEQRFRARCLVDRTTYGSGHQFGLIAARHCFGGRFYESATTSGRLIVATLAMPPHDIRNDLMVADRMSTLQGV
jgi:hypothetical protein